MILKAGDVISGKEGTAFITVNGQVKELFYAKTIEASLEKVKTEIRALGKRGIQSKTVNWRGTGSINIYYITSLFRQLALKYVKTGVDTYFDLQIVNEDKTSSVGKQVIVLKDCNLNSAVMAKLDATTDDALDETYDFTFEDVEILSSFTGI